MGVQCQILIDKSKEGVHRAGNPVTGNVRYIIDEPTEFQHVTLSFLGKGKCVWRQGSGKHGRTYRGSEDYVINHVNVFNKRPEVTITLEGKYEHPFEFFLPQDIPRSYKDYIGCISYKIKLKFEKPSFFSFNKIFTAEIPVYCYLNPTTEGPVIFGLQKELFAPFASKTPVVKLKAEIEKAFLTPGENAQITYIVTNDTDVEITSVKTELHCYKTYTSDYDHKRYIREKVPTCETETPSILKKEVTRFVCLLPTLPGLYSIQNSKVISVQYNVRATVKLPMPHMNATVEVPVQIGEMKGVIDPAVDMPQDGEHPPPYWKSMNEGEKKGDKSDDDSD